jgi:LysR family transcriptional regulator for metE and metH
MAWHLDTRMLRMIIAVAEAPSSTAAAARLNITPSALSHQIRNAEAALRVTLFERAGRRLSLTPLGEQLLASARTIIGELERAEGTLERSRRAEKPSVRVGGGAYPVHRWFLPRLTQIDGEWPIIDFANGKTYPLSRAVALGELDIAFAAGEQHERGVAALPLFQDDLVAVFASSHDLARHVFIEARDLASETYVTYSRVVEHGLEDDLLFKPARLAPAEIREASSVEAILDILSTGLGFSILSAWAVRTSPRVSSLITRPLTADGLKVGWSALIRTLERTDPVFSKVISRLSEQTSALGTY